MFVFLIHNIVIMFHCGDPPNQIHLKLTVPVQAFELQTSIIASSDG